MSTWWHGSSLVFSMHHVPEATRCRHDGMAALWCSVCTMFQRQLESMRNFRAAFIEGSANIRVSIVNIHSAFQYACTCNAVIPKPGVNVQSLCQPSGLEMTLLKNKCIIKQNLLQIVVKEKYAIYNEHSNIHVLDLKKCKRYRVDQVKKLQRQVA